MMNPAAVNKALNVLWANRFDTNRELIDEDGTYGTELAIEK